MLELLPDRRHIAREVSHSFALFGKRKVPLTLIYSEGDFGLDHVYFHLAAQQPLQRVEPRQALAVIIEAT
ncbi:hypothetical protein AB9F34_34885, partial [Rhizobium leguminosarum]|uniref:hypothetical protein n=1 Tax=Rhizobium leguminosarum TaxID=384 RepID=UPI003F9460F4